MEEFINLHNRTVSRSEVERVISIAKEQNNTEVIYRLSRILNAYPTEQRFVINIKDYPTPPTALAGAHHTGDYREALDENGRLKKGWKFSNGQVVKITPKKAPDTPSTEGNKENKLYKFIVVTGHNFLGIYSYNDPKIEGFWQTNTTDNGIQIFTAISKGKKITKKKGISLILQKYTEGKDFIFVEYDYASLNKYLLLLEKPILGLSVANDELTFLAAAGIDYFEQAPDDEAQGLGKPIPAADIYKMITDKVISMFKNAKASDYHRAWKDDAFFIPLNFDSKKPYRGVNRLLLQERIGFAGAFRNPYFLTFNQIKKHGGRLKKGTRGYEVVYYSIRYIVPADKNTGRKAYSSTNAHKVIDFIDKHKLSEDIVTRIPMIRYYNVYNGASIEGIDFQLDKLQIGRAVPDTASENQAAALIVENYPNPPAIKHEGNQAYYSPSGDYVKMPKKEQFDSINDYYRTLFHELTHSTGHDKRLNRGINLMLEKEDYAKEELVAEFGAVFLSAWAGIMWYNNKNHAAYLKNWNSAIKEAENDNKFLMKAASLAQAATDYILNLNAAGQPAFLSKYEKLDKKAKKTKPEAQKATEKADNTDKKYKFIAFYNSYGRINGIYSYQNLTINEFYLKNTFDDGIKVYAPLRSLEKIEEAKRIIEEQYIEGKDFICLKFESKKREEYYSLLIHSNEKPKPESSLYEAFSELLSQIKSTNADIPSNELEDFLYNFGSQHYIEKEKIYTFFYDKVTKPIGSLSAYKKHPLFTKVKNPQPHHAGYTTSKRGTEILNIFIKDFEALKQQYDYNHYSFTKFWNIATEKPKKKAEKPSAKITITLKFSDVEANRQMIEGYRNSSTGKINLLKTDMIGTQFHLSMFEKYMAIDDIAALYGKGRKEEAQKDYAFVKERIESAFNHHLRAAKEYNTIEQCTERFIELLPDLLAKGGQWLEAKARNKNAATAKGKFTKAYKQIFDEIASIAVGAKGNSSSKENTPKKAPRAAQYTGVKTIPLSDLYTDEKRFQNRKKLNEEIVENIVNNFKPTDLDPLVVWYDKKQGKTFVLAGHHRFEALKRLKHKNVPVKFANDDYPTEADAIRYAKEISNANRTLEEPYERAAIYRKYREEGYSEKEINDKGALEGKNRSYILNLSCLNPKGATMSTLVQFSQTQSKADKNEAERVADWIGQARRNAPELTDAHEKEMFDFLMNKEASKRTTTKVKFLEYVRACWNPFEPTAPLNLARMKYQSEGEKQYDEEVERYKTLISDLQNNIGNLKDRFINPANKDFVNPEAPDYMAVKKIADNKIAEYNTQIQYYQKELLKLYSNKQSYLKPTGQIALFGSLPIFKTLKEAKKYFKAWAYTHLRGKKVFHKELDKYVVFSSKGIDHVLSSKISLKKMYLIQQAEEMLKNSHLIAFVEDYKKRDNIKGAYRMRTTATFEGEEVKVILTLREGENGVVYYDHKIEEIEESTTPPRKSRANPFCGDSAPTNTPAKTVPNTLANRQIDKLAVPTVYVEHLPEETNQQISTSANTLDAKMAALQTRNWETFVIANPQLQRFLGDVERKTSESTVITIAGGAGSGKTRFAFQFINALAQNYTVGHASLEEHPDSKLYYDKVQQYIDETALPNIEAPEIKNLDQLEALIQRNEVIVIDSFAKLQELNPRFLLDRDLRKKYDGKLFLLIYQLTGEGKMRGGSKSEYDGDIILLTHVAPDYRENYIYPSKNRYNALPATQLRYSTYFQQMLDIPQELGTGSQPTEAISLPPAPQTNVYEVIY